MPRSVKLATYKRVLGQVVRFMNSHQLPGTIEVDLDRGLGPCSEVMVAVSAPEELASWDKHSAPFQIAKYLINPKKAPAIYPDEMQYIVLQQDAAAERAPEAQPVPSGWILWVRYHPHGGGALRRPEPLLSDLGGHPLH